MSESLFHPAEIVKWYPVYNDSGEEIPPFAAMEVTGSDADGIFEVIKPTTDNQVAGILFNGRLPIPIDSYGAGTWDFPCAVAFDDASTPANGDEIGVDAGEWYLDSDHSGFICLSEGTVVTGNTGYVAVTPISPSAPIRDWNYWRRTWLGGGAFSTHDPFPCSLPNALNMEPIRSDSLFSNGAIYLVPFFSPVGATLKSLGILIHTAASTAGAKARIGIYQPAGDTVDFTLPSVLVSDMGEISVDSTGFKYIEADVTLAAKNMNFAAIQFDNASGKLPGVWGYPKAQDVFGSSGLKYARVNSNATNSTGTLANISDLTIPHVRASGKYNFKAAIYVVNSTASGGITFDFGGGTATMTTFRAHVKITDSSALQTTTQVTSLTTLISASTITNDSIIEIDGAFTVNVAGSFMPRFAYNGSGTVTVYLGSILEVYDLGSPFNGLMAPYGYRILNSGNLDAHPVTSDSFVGLVKSGLGALAALPDPITGSAYLRLSSNSLPMLFFEYDN